MQWEKKRRNGRKNERKGWMRGKEKRVRIGSEEEREKEM